MISIKNTRELKRTLLHYFSPNVESINTFSLQEFCPQFRVEKIPLTNNIEIKFINGKEEILHDGYRYQYETIVAYLFNFKDIYIRNPVLLKQFVELLEKAVDIIDSRNSESDRIQQQHYDFVFGDKQTN